MARTIAVTGKGGTGKTLLSALIVRHLKEHTSGPLLALDADPDANLATVLGMEVERSVADLREDTVKKIKDLPLGMSKSSYIEAGLHEIIVETEKVDFISMGRGEGPGCYCYINNLLRGFADKLQSSYQWIVVDNEAGLEHLSRRTASKVDQLLVVINDNPLSIDCARRIDAVTAELKQGVGRKAIVVNNVRDEKRIEILREKIGSLDMAFLGSIPHDSTVEEYIFEGRSLFELDDSPAIARVDEIMQNMKE